MNSLRSRFDVDEGCAQAVSKGWVSKLVARYRSDGDAAFVRRSRHPKTSPHATVPVVVG